MENQWRSLNALADCLNAGAKHPTFTVPSLRHHIKQASQNGLAPHVRKLGKKILVNEEGFRSWIAEHGRAVGE